MLKKGYHTEQTQPGVLIKAVLDDIRREKICGSLKKRSLTPDLLVLLLA